MGRGVVAKPMTGSRAELLCPVVQTLNPKSRIKPKDLRLLQERLTRKPNPWCPETQTLIPKAESLTPTPGQGLAFIGFRV